MIVRRETKEYTENGVAYNMSTLYFCGILVRKSINSTTNASVVNQLKTEKQKHKPVKGFKNEVKN